VGKASKSVIVAVPVETAFAYLADWHNVTKYREEVADYRPVSQRTTGDGARFAYRLPTPSGELDVEAQLSDYRENVGFTLTNLRGPRIIECWSLATRAPGQTTVVCAVEYPVPSGDPTSFMNLLLLKGHWSDRVKRRLRRLKELLEKAQP
jgi:uncharacterized membrane protein